MIRRLGLDFGNVIGSQDLRHHIPCLPIPGAFWGIRQLVKSEMFEEIYIISYCPRQLQSFARAWFLTTFFWWITGMKPANLIFCEHYWQKGEICRELGITDFVDDRPIVLTYLVTVPAVYAFHPAPETLYQCCRPLAAVTNQWSSLVPLLLRDQKAANEQSYTGAA